MSVVLVFNAEKKFPLSTCAYYLLSCHCVPQRWVWRDLFYTLHSMSINTDQIPSGVALLQAKLQLSQSLQAQEMLHSPNHVLIIFVAHLVHELHVSVLHLGPTSWSTLCPTFQVRGHGISYSRFCRRHEISPMWGAVTHPCTTTTKSPEFIHSHQV